MILTIGVPTYNRAESVSRLLRNLIDDTTLLPIDILVIDDGSEDGTYSRLIDDPTVVSRVRVLKNDVNRGYSGTFARLFSECRTDYLMVVADDDRIATEQLSSVIAYLERERPAFVSPQFLRGTTIYRGKNVTGPIAPKDFSQSSAHASGLIYRVDACDEALAELAERVDNEEADALVYPQIVILVMLLLAASKCEWLAIPTVYEGSYEPSGIRDADGHAYWSLESRWRQLTAFESFMTKHLELTNTNTAQNILDAHRSNVFAMISSAIRGENPSLGDAFDRGAKDLYRPSLRKVIMRLPIWRIRRRSTT